jgi:hypothetical protein
MTSAIFVIDMPGSVSGGENGNPGNGGTTTLRSVSSGRTRSNRRIESGQPCSSTTVAVASGAVRCTARYDVPATLTAFHGSDWIRFSAGRQSYEFTQ